MAEKTNNNGMDAAGMQGSLFGDAGTPSFSPQGSAEKPAPNGTPVSDASASPARTARARAAELNRILNHAAYAYYALDAPEMTDAQFDRPTPSAWAATSRSSSSPCATPAACTPSTTP